MGTGRYYEALRYSTLGLPLELHYQITWKYIALGVTGFANLNRQRNITGLSGTMYLGRFR